MSGVNNFSRNFHPILCVPMLRHTKTSCVDTVSTNYMITIFPDIKLILDFVPNHSSDEHEWFVKSVQKDDKYADYYVWHDGRSNGTDIIPPNNWVGKSDVWLTVHRNSVWIRKTN